MIATITSNPKWNGDYVVQSATSFYRGCKITVKGDEFEVFQSGKMVAWGMGYSDPLSRAKELVEKDFVTPLLEQLRLVQK